jgi:hypothetical protein
VGDSDIQRLYMGNPLELLVENAKQSQPGMWKSCQPVTQKSMNM